MLLARDWRSVRLKSAYAGWRCKQIVVLARGVLRGRVRVSGEAKTAGCAGIVRGLPDGERRGLSLTPLSPLSSSSSLSSLPSSLPDVVNNGPVALEEKASVACRH
jgi:hypothetical protein